MFNIPTAFDVKNTLYPLTLNGLSFFPFLTFASLVSDIIFNTAPNLEEAEINFATSPQQPVYTFVNQEFSAIVNLARVEIQKKRKSIYLITCIQILTKITNNSIDKQK